MRILLFNWKDLAHPHAGGAEVFVHEVARRWVSAGHDATLVCSAINGRPAREYIAGIEIIRLGGRLSVYHQARQYWRKHGTNRYDLVIDGVNTRPFLCAEWICDTPVVTLFHQLCRDIWFHETPLPVALAGRFLLEPSWLRRCRDVPALTVSQSTEHELVSAGFGDVRRIPIGCTPALRQAVVKEQRPTIMYLGRMTGSKRPEHTVAAFRLIRASTPEAQLWMVGAGPRLDTLRRRATEPGITFFGRVSDEHRDYLLSRAHVLVMTSVREGWGLTVDEAAAAGTPTVGYDCPGLRESVSAAGGVLVPPRPGALASELRRRLPAWVERPAAHGWSGGAAHWDEVADRALAAATSGQACRFRPAA